MAPTALPPPEPPYNPSRSFIATLIKAGVDVVMFLITLPLRFLGAALKAGGLPVAGLIVAGLVLVSVFASFAPSLGFAINIWPFSIWSDFKQGLIEQGKAECRAETNAASMAILKEDNERKDAELRAAAEQVRLLEAARLRDAVEKDRLKAEAAEAHEAINESKSDAICGRPDKVINAMNALAKKKIIPEPPEPAVLVPSPGSSSRGAAKKLVSDKPSGFSGWFSQPKPLAKPPANPPPN